MKSCSKCDRKYADETLVFCLGDGSTLLWKKPPGRLLRLMSAAGSAFLIGLLTGGLIAAAGCGISKRDAGATIKEGTIDHSVDNSTNKGNSNQAGNTSAKNKTEDEISGCRLSETDRSLSAKIKMPPASFKILPETEDVLRSLAEDFKKLPDDCLIEIGNHTDAAGDEKANIALTEKRAEAIKEFFVKLGMPEKKMKAVGYGSSTPKSSDTTSEGLGQNRRTEIKLYTENSRPQN